MRHLAFFLLFLGCLLASCVDEIVLETNEGESRIVIEGEITTQKPPYTIRIREVGQFAKGPDAVQLPVTEAAVYLFDNEGNQAQLQEEKPGEYRSAADGMQGEIGKIYHIEVILSDGTLYASKPEKMQPVPLIDSLTFEEVFIQELSGIGNILNIPVVRPIVHTSLPVDRDTYLRWRIWGEYEFTEGPDLLEPNTCYVKEDIDFDNVVIFSNENTDGTFILRQAIIEEQVDFRFTFKYSFLVEQQSLTENAYRFWSAVNREFERSGDLFEPPPALIQGNIFNKNDATEIVLGYFSANAMDASRLFVRGLDLEHNRPVCAFRQSAPQWCLNCLSLPKSTLERPPYWE